MSVVLPRMHSIFILTHILFKQPIDTWFQKLNSTFKKSFLLLPALSLSFGFSPHFLCFMLYAHISAFCWKLCLTL